MNRRYFGTDGIRGRVGEAPITPDFMLKLGWAVGRVFTRQKHNRGKVLIGKDTRISGYMFESALEAGLSAAGADVHLLGPMPTPATAYLTRSLRAQLGIVISASHNPYTDNGVKFFSPDGIKLSDDVELSIEAELDKSLQLVATEQLGKASRVKDAAGRYIEFCKRSIPISTLFTGLKVVLDCAHGATYDIAPSIFRELGAKVITMGAEPDGFNINVDCGSTKPAALQQRVKAEQADLGIAFDGDGDRLVMVDAEGTLLDGDAVLYMIARELHEQGQLQGGVVGTAMSNFGLEQAFKTLKIPFMRSQVGDRYVAQALRERDWQLGGETSGHVICRWINDTGDGIVAALQVMAAMTSRGCALKELASGFCAVPQVLKNIRIDNPGRHLDHPKVVDTVSQIQKNLINRGRVLVRASGTEPVIRVMVEGENHMEIDGIADEICAVIKDHAEVCA